MESVATRSNEAAPLQPTAQPGVTAAMQAMVNAIANLALAPAITHPHVEEHVTQLTSRHVFNNTRDNFLNQRTRNLV